MQKFDLSVWLQDKSRKVVTRRGNPVRIICTDRKHGEDNLPIVFLEQCHNGEFLLTCRNDGRCDNYDTQYDLFFADEEDALSEFEKEILNLLNCATPEGHGAPTIEKTKEYSQQLLDLARKELEKSIEDGAIEFAKSYMEDVNPSFEKVQESEELWKWKMSCLKGVNKAYAKGEQDALKSLPKWKKATEHKEFAVHVCVMDEDMYPYLDTEVNECEYYIELDNLKNLPKEE